jgi:GNAT superfamily N-acetyltransferase
VRGFRLGPPERLADTHELDGFRCGRPDLDTWLQRHARVSEGRSARTYVVAARGRVAGYYCLAAGSVARAELPRATLRRNQPEQVPVIVIGRLAVAGDFASRGIGKGLLKDAIRRSLSAAEAIGVRAILVHAIDEPAAGFYRKFGFAPFPSGGLTLVLPLETAVAALGVDSN